MTNNQTIQDVFPVLGMGCASCAATIEKTLIGKEGVVAAVVNYAAATITVEYNPLKITPELFRKTIQEVGYDLLIDTVSEAMSQEVEQIHAVEYRKLKHRVIGAVVLSAPLVIIGMAFMDMPYANEIMWLFSTPVVFWFGRGFFSDAWKQMKHRQANMNTLVATSTGIAYFFSVFNILFSQFWHLRGIYPHVYFEASGVIIAFILLGRLLEERAKGNTRTAIKKLMVLQPKTATIVSETGIQEEIPIRHVVAGNVLLVKPGEKIAVDGTVIEGCSYVDESMLNGEPLPVFIEQGAKVIAGTINQNGSFCFRAEKVGAATLLAQIIRMVQTAQGSKAPVQKLVDKIAAIFVPIIMGIALLAFIFWLLIDSANGFSHGLMAMVTVLIIACPCALGLATPTAIMVGIGKGAEKGILIKDAESLEIAKKVNAVILDKTGTITEGKPAVADLIWIHEDDNAKSIFYSLEKHSEHPLANAVASYLILTDDDTEVVPIKNIENIPGKGIKGSFGGKTWFAGSARLMHENDIAFSPQLEQQAEEWEREAMTTVWFADDERTLAVTAIVDRIKESSIAAIDQLKKQGIEVYMLTGDQETTAFKTAAKAGIAHYRAGVLPHEKAAFVKRLQESGNIVAMAGDGINDSAALAQADLSIAMGKGSDIAMDTAQMTIISSDLLKIPEAIRLSTLTVRTIRQNLFWAFFYNLIAVPIAAGILYPINGFTLNPMIAGLAMALSSISVVANSLYLKTKQF